jgi:hypothetical protein
MAELAQYPAAKEREETFKKRIYERLMKMRDLLRRKRLEVDLSELPELEPRMLPIKR